MIILIELLCFVRHLESVLAYFRPLFSNNAVHYVIRTAAANMHFSPVYPMNADEQKASLLSCCLLLRLLGVMSPIVY